MRKKSKKKQIVAMTLALGAQQLGWHVRCLRSRSPARHG